MVALNFSDGSTKKFDLSVEEEKVELNRLGQDTSALKKITGLWLMINKQHATLPMPWRFRRVFFYAKELKSKTGNYIAGEELTVQADDVRLILTGYYGSKPVMVRVDLKHTGKQRFIPKGG